MSHTLRKSLVNFWEAAVWFVVKRDDSHSLPASLWQDRHSFSAQHMEKPSTARMSYWFALRYLFFICRLPRKWLPLRTDKHRRSNCLHYAAIWNGTKTISSVAGFIIKNAFLLTYSIHSDLLFHLWRLQIWNEICDIFRLSSYTMFRLILKSVSDFTIGCMYNTLWKIIFLVSTFVLFCSKNV